MVTTDASPYLVNLPAGPSGTVARRVYRQFLSEAQNGVMGHVIKPDANGNSIPNNTYPSFRDDTWSTQRGVNSRGSRICASSVDR
ncbi:hypothetical protein MF271_22960 (plasmid) [Deinococcus sp. KNUC1210]|uniref:hypothetical protein n=1 Tax=Deinococcus sp. KNUC1210 TaxID=2917691 RepID=UPI001EF01555|nr:hypothetical protein [Deinococcus sp. KNUC1210]ULH18322.1 hypothetical protein MF271_22960 [Deinococcus sp. KNUC1210]